MVRNKLYRWHSAHETSPTMFFISYKRKKYRRRCCSHLMFVAFLSYFCCCCCWLSLFPAISSYIAVTYNWSYFVLSFFVIQLVRWKPAARYDVYFSNRTTRTQRKKTYNYNVLHCNKQTQTQKRRTKSDKCMAFTARASDMFYTNIKSITRHLKFCYITISRLYTTTSRCIHCQLKMAVCTCNNMIYDAREITKKNQKKNQIRFSHFAAYSNSLMRWRWARRDKDQLIWHCLVARLKQMNRKIDCLINLCVRARPWTNRVIIQEIGAVLILLSNYYYYLWYILFICTRWWTGDRGG